MKSSLFAALTALVGLGAGLMPVPAAASKGVPVEVRVVTFKGKILADGKIRTGTTTVPTSRQATCLGGEPPNGKRKIKGANALGALAQLNRRVRALKPLLLSAAYDFGIGVCGIGGSVATDPQWWALKVNGKLSSKGGDKTRLRKDDKVLWYLDRDYGAPFPGELRIRMVGDSEVKVVSFDGAGKRSPAVGAKVFAGGSEVGVTNRKGRANVRIPSRGRKKVSVVARMAGQIPSNRLEVRNGT